MDAPFAFRLPLEVLHRIRHIDFVALDTSFDQRFIQQLSRRTHKWFSREIFVVARLFTHKNDFGVTRAFAKNRLRSRFPQRTRPTSACRFLEFPNTRSRRNQRSGGSITIFATAGASCGFFRQAQFHVKR
jgi:hypothetical protein